MKASDGAPTESPFRSKQTRLKTLFMVLLCGEMLDEGAAVLHHAHISCMKGVLVKTVNKSEHQELSFVKFAVNRRC